MYEVELKVKLNNSFDAVNKFLGEVSKHGKLEFINFEEQYNHYFTSIDLKELPNSFIDKYKIETDLGSNISIRTRSINNKQVYLVIKSQGDSVNGDVRKEYNYRVKESLGQLDDILLLAGSKYQSKWSRKRTNYVLSGIGSHAIECSKGEYRQEAWDINLSVDKNAGYGYIAELELIAENENESSLALDVLNRFLKKVQYQSLDKGELNIMYQYYVAHWDSFYKSLKLIDIKQARQWYRQKRA